MIPADIKNLKVAELRAKLKERGLDTKGLKAELVARLTSAVEVELQASDSDIQRGGGLSDEGNSHNKEITQEDQAVDPAIKTLLSKADCRVVVERISPTTVYHVENSVSPPSSTSSYEFIPSHTDRGTQTEIEFVVDSSTVTRCCNCARESDTNISDTCLMGDSKSSSKSSVQENVVTEPPSCHVNVPEKCPQQAVDRGTLTGEFPECTESTSDRSISAASNVSTGSEVLETEMEQENQGVKSPQTGRGRDYYEFKEEIHYKRAKTQESETVLEDEIDHALVRLDSYNSDLHFEMGTDGCSGQPLLWEKFPLLWSGCRLTHGVQQGKVGFEVKFEKKLSAPEMDIGCDPDPQVLRVGWSVDNSSLQLGKVELSYGFDSRGKKITGGREENFGQAFSEGDVIGCYASLSEGSEVELSFYKNGFGLGVAFRLSSSTLGGRALYPHVLCKNCSISVNLSSTGEPWYPGPPGYCPLAALPPEQRTRAPPPPTLKSECEVLMMVGMPGAGKTHWAQAHMTQNPEKRYNLLSTESVLNCMGKEAGPEHGEVWLQQATQCVSQLIRVAARKKRNYILDQVNIYPSSQRHKMLSFHGYQRRAVVVFPSDEEWRRRLEQRHKNEGVRVPEMSLLKVKVAFTLPEKGDLLEEVLFVELSRDKVQKLLTDYKEEARRLLPPPPKRKNPQIRHHKHSKRGHITLGDYGWNQGYFNQQPYLQPQSYGYNSDPQRYREYYRPYTGQWNSCYQDTGYYGDPSYNYTCQQGFW
ncbi:heterogeneous nuclear ribonucleoprotein U-like protein 1 [Chanos chanos]|uniref:Heterogeneous nuclear ribonucleoprotein U-like protein 1 n=1 Tax=Chanos chanos TaxID=29144 RepID=A0A6J2ULX2_CHACN|nr:heterogeneous nuclear ribonucleoprotein U-like protein 1 [Chanos chanos]